MCDGLCICCDEIMIFVRKIDETGPKRSEDAFHQSLRFIGRSVLDDHLEENTKVFRKNRSEAQSTKKKTSQPADNHDAKIVVGQKKGGKKGGRGENGPKKGSD